MSPMYIATATQEKEGSHMAIKQDNYILPIQCHLHKFHTVAPEDCLGMKGKPPSDNNSGEMKKQSQ